MLLVTVAELRRTLVETSTLDSRAVLLGTLGLLTSCADHREACHVCEEHRPAFCPPLQLHSLRIFEWSLHFCVLSAQLIGMSDSYTKRYSTQLFVWNLEPHRKPQTLPLVAFMQHGSVFDEHFDAIDCRDPFRQTCSRHSRWNAGSKTLKRCEAHVKLEG